MYYGNVWSMANGETMVGVTHNPAPRVDDEGNRLVATYEFDDLFEAVIWYFGRI